ncbi:MAG: zinc metallopeptidase [Verrucomicrobiota bacterium]
MLGFGLVLIGIALAFALWSRRQWQEATELARQETESDLTAGQYAEWLLAHVEASGVEVRARKGAHSSGYDPKRKLLLLEEGIYEGRSVGDFASAVHEVGHALQDQRDLSALDSRQTVVRWLQLGPIFFLFAALAAKVFLKLPIGLTAVFFGLAWLGCLLVHLLTVTVEWDASRRGLKAAQEYANHRFPFGREEEQLARKVLKAARWRDPLGILASGRFLISRLLGWGK